MYSGFAFPTFRAILGPQSLFLCRVSTVIQCYAGMNLCFFMLVIDGARYYLVFVCKAITVIDDNFFVFCTTLTIYFWSFVATAAKFYIEEKTTMVEKICTGIWDAENHSKLEIPVAAYVCILSIVVHALVGWKRWRLRNQLIPVNAKRRANESFVSFASFWFTFSTALILAVGSSAFIIENRSNVEEMNEFPKMATQYIFGTFSLVLLNTNICLMFFVSNKSLRNALKNKF